MKEIKVIVQTGRKDVVLTVPQQTKIADIVAEVVREAGYATGETYTLLLGETRMEPQRTLVSYHRGDEVTLVLTDGGGGAAVSQDLAAALVASEMPHLLHLGEGKWTIEASTPTSFRVYMRSPIDQEAYIAEFLCDSYREVPPYIDFIDPVDGRPGTQRAYPKSSDGWFHHTPCICKPFCRKAYTSSGGPHEDWHFPDWVRNVPNYSTLGDIVLGIYARISDRNLYQGPMQPRQTEGG